MNRASCGLLFGGINTLKTTNLGRAAKYLYDTYGCVARLISADNEYETIAPEINAGIIDPFSIVAIPNPFGVCCKLQIGYWPEVRDGRIVMCKPRIENGRMLDRHGRWIGAYLIEGTTTIAELFHQDHINNQRKIGEDLVGKFEVAVETDTGMEVITLAKSAQSHYGQVQNHVTQSMIPAMSMLPGLKWVWWTGHEYAGEDEATGQMRLGPGVVGKAATMVVPRKMGNTFHMVSVESSQVDARTRKVKRSIEHRAYFESHADANLITQMWPAGVKLPPVAVPEWRNMFPDGYIPLTFDQGIEAFIKFHDKHEIKIVVAVPDNLPVPAVSGEVPGLQTGSPAPVSLPLPVQPQTGIGQGPAVQQAMQAATQTQPVGRPSLRRPLRPIVMPTPQPPLADQLQKSIDVVNQAKQQAAAVEDLSSTPTPTVPEIPGINDLPNNNDTNDNNNNKEN